MDRNTTLLIGIIVLLAIVGFVMFIGFGDGQTPGNGIGPANGTSTENGVGGAPEVSQVAVALLDTEGQTTSTLERGCDHVVMVSRDIATTTMPLNAAIEELFELGTTTVEGWYNFIAKTDDTLSFDRATVERGTARIYLEGELTGLAGVCDNPRARIQIEETALQFPTVEDVELYLNGELTDLSPDARGGQ